MEAAVEFERGIAGVDIFRIIIGKFSHWQEPCPVILLVVDKGPKVGLHCAILPFSLPVSLGVKGGREPSLNTEEVT